jgi:hypothetical protein
VSAVVPLERTVASRRLIALVIFCSTLVNPVRSISRFSTPDPDAAIFVI